MKNIMEKEKDIVEFMIDLYCLNHPGDEISIDCNELKEYARERLTNCPYQENKPVCRKCTIHCYNPQMKSKIRTVMRYSGPRVIFHKPKLAFFHLMHSLKK